MDKLKQEILDYLRAKYGLDQKVYWGPQKDGYFDWIPVLNEKLFFDLPVPTLFYRLDNNLIELAKEYDFVTENKWQLNGFDYSGYKAEALCELACGMASKWGQYYDVMFNADICRFEAVRNRLRSFGIGGYGVNPCLRKVSPLFRKLVREVDPRDCRQF